MGHAHHTLPLIYLEEARAAYWREVAGRKEVGEIDYVIAEITVQFHKRIYWPGSLEVGLKVSRIGRKSFEMEFEITDQEGEIMAKGKTVQVGYDYKEGRAREIEQEIKRRIEEYEG
jgi:acyl-CoA thioester hydrolase